MNPYLPNRSWLWLSMNNPCGMRGSITQDGYRCIGMDLRGFGKSDRPWTGYTYDRLSDDERAVIEALKLKEMFYLLDSQ
jgi:pimeloyl-ACP methyl ester carboxylesterase